MTRRFTLESLRSAWPLPDLRGAESKEDRGRVVVVGGSRKVAGAAVLAAEAALRAGAGKLQIGTARDVARAVAMAVPEAKVIDLPCNRDGEIAKATAEILSAAKNADAVLVGPGMSTSATTTAAAGRLAAVAPRCVLDAGAMAAFARHPFGAAVITPHFGEMAGLCECDKESIAAAPDVIAREFANAHGVLVVLKAAITHVASPDGSLWVYRGGSIGLGTSGSGDVLAGVIAGLIAQGAPVDQAALWGVALHGAAGAVLARRRGDVGYLAREISFEIPPLRSQRSPPRAMARARARKMPNDRGSRR